MLNPHIICVEIKTTTGQNEMRFAKQLKVNRDGRDVNPYTDNDRMLTHSVIKWNIWKM